MNTQDMDLKKLEGVVEAVLKSFVDRDEFHCLQGTRTVLLQQIMDWAITRKAVAFIRPLTSWPG
jgi:hypothetical protein